MNTRDVPDLGPFAPIYRLALPFLDVRQNDAHTRVAYGFASRLLRMEGGDASVVLPAVILHDVGWKTIPEELHLKAFGPRENDRSINRKHEVEGARIAARILAEVDYEAALAAEIVAIIEGHDSRREPLSRNDALVKDADKLWRFSAEALQIDPARFQVDPVVHVKWLSARIPEWFLTKTALRAAWNELELRALSLGVTLAPEGAS
jgi:HD superfamily phosphohydrolase YqeK